MPTTSTKPIRLADVPVAPSVDLASLKGDDGLEVMAIFEPRSQADTNVLKALLAKAKAGLLSGGKGHITAAEASHRFVDPALHWVGGIELPDGRIAFRGLVDAAQADLARWIKAGQISFEPWMEGNAVALDALSSHRSARGVAAVAAIDDDSSADDSSADGGDSSDSGNAGDSGNNGDSSNSDDATGNSSSASGEMDLITAAMSQPGLTKVAKSITPMGQDMGEILKPIGYDSNYTNAKPQDTSTNETVAGLPTRRRSI
jgi:hypothetical protein